jgi:plasmid stabilization system protein ParE
LKLEWSTAAITDLDRFATFVHDRYQRLAPIIARELVRKSASLIEHPRLGRAVAGRQEYREIVMRVLGADYVFQYRLEPDRIVMLRVFHGRERRE